MRNLTCPWADFHQAVRTQAVDVLTPLGRGQAQLVTGPRGAGKSRCAMDAVLGQVPWSG